MHLYLYDNCSDKAREVKDPGPGMYYGAFVLRKGVKRHQVNFRDQKDVCKNCRCRGTAQCPKVLRVRSGISPRQTRREVSDSDRSMVVTFRSDRKRGQG